MMENEYARILLELGIPGLVMWVLFIGWIFTRGEIRKNDMFYLGRRLAYVAVRLYVRDRPDRHRALHVGAVDGDRAAADRLDRRP